MADNFKSGINGKATVNGTELAIINWNTEATVEKVEFKNSRTGTTAKKELTYRDVRFSMEVDIDLDANPFAAPLNVRAGTKLTNVRLFINGLTGLGWTFPSAVVMGTPQRLEVAGKVITTFNCENDGPYGEPGVTPA
jgi:hypothetical protein